MNLKDVKIDGSTRYLSSYKGVSRPCVIVASFVFDGATLVAMSMEEETYLQLWATEACRLEPA